MNRYSYDYPRPAVSADCVLFGYDGEELNLLLIKRGREPCKGRWAFPGGFMNMDETTRQCADRELKEETGIENLRLEQLGAFSGVDRDPRGRVISVVYFALIRMHDYKPVAGDDAAKAQWFRIEDIPPLAFDHDLVYRKAIDRLKSALNTENGMPEFAGGQFTYPELNKIKAIIASERIG